MRKILFTWIALASLTAEAKKVKFAVDMQGVDVSPMGIHVAGDFQVLAGEAPEDWVSDSTELLQEGSTSIYSTVVDIPAFKKYEYKFINGDQFYETEFVPIASRIGHDFNDNRWIYVDSLKDDTTYIGAIRYAQNSPAGTYLLRFVVETQNIIVDAEGIHMASSFAGLDPTATVLYSFVENRHEVISYVPEGMYTYRYVNGITLAGVEQITAGCADVMGNRTLTVAKDTLLPPICFAACVSCDEITAIHEDALATLVQVYPNPSKGRVTLDAGSLAGKNFTIRISDAQGQTLRSFQNVGLSTVQLQPGLYMVSTQQAEGPQHTQKIVVE